MLEPIAIMRSDSFEQNLVALSMIGWSKLSPKLMIESLRLPPHAGFSHFLPV